MKVLLLVVLALALVPARPAEGGGWVVVSLDTLPGAAVAGEEQEVRFVVRQHGVRPANGFAVQLQAVHRDSDRALTIPATDTGRDGRYTARLALPEPGWWDWQVHAWGRPHPMPPIHVSPAPGAASAPVPPALARVGQHVYYGPAPEPAPPPIGWLTATAALLAFAGAWRLTPWSPARRSRKQS